MRNQTSTYNTYARVAVVISIFAAIAILPFGHSLAQRGSKKTSPKVTGVSSKKTGSGEVISLSADSSLNGIQTWQDPNGTFHLVVPNAGDSAITNTPGVKMRRVGNSLEVEVQAKKGANVTVQPRFNRLDLVVQGGTEERPSAADGDRVPRNARTAKNVDESAETVQSVARLPRESRAPRGIGSLDRIGSGGSGGDPLTTPIGPSKNVVVPVTSVANSSISHPPNDQVSSPVEPSANQATETAAAPPPPQTAPVAPEESSEREISSYVFYSGWWITVALIAGLAGLVVWRRKGKGNGEGFDDDESQIAVGTPKINTALVNSIVGERRSSRDRRRESRGGGRRAQDSPAKVSSEIIEPHEQSLVPRNGVAMMAPATLFGAYRVDQEIGKLILGQAHRIDVLASRAGDDRRAMEASLLKALRSNYTDEDGRRRARLALEEYGFVARQCAALLLAGDSCDRAAAARMLGEVQSAASLQFLLEALYDSEVIVRTQAVESIGALKLPSAIGALLDMARRYPDMPSSLLSSALNACSIESLDFLESAPAQPALLSYSSHDSAMTNEITQLEPAAIVQDLPESSDDELLVDALAHIQSTDADARAAAAQSLSLYRVARSVIALKELVENDPEPGVRAAAVSSLGCIDHESVFSAVLVALADEARDVRAAAARSLSRLSFDRAEALVRVIETSDVNELGKVARACIQTGMAAQALDRLSSDDRRQAYEAFSLLSLLAKANEAQPILDAVENHTDWNVRLIAVQVLGASASAEIGMKLRHLAIRESIPEQVRTALMEVVYKLDEMQPA
jgi:HEAT repeat protein